MIFSVTEIPFFSGASISKFVESSFFLTAVAWPSSFISLFIISEDPSASISDTHLAVEGSSEIINTWYWRLCCHVFCQLQLRDSKWSFTRRGGCDAIAVFAAAKKVLNPWFKTVGVPLIM